MIGDILAYVILTLGGLIIFDSTIRDPKKEFHDLINFIGGLVMISLYVGALMRLGVFG